MPLRLSPRKLLGKGGMQASKAACLARIPRRTETVRAGRFGPYVNRGNTNATLIGGMSPETITLEEAIRLIEDKQGAGTRSRAKKTKAGRAEDTRKGSGGTKTGGQTAGAKIAEG